jgi:hypothetical protein
MKKYLFGIFAIALAIGFSAFTTAKKSTAVKTADLYWYEVTYDQFNQPLIEEQDPVVEAVENAGYLDCGGSLKTCISGHEAPLSFSSGPITEGTDGVARFEKN